jgi:Putative DNA-binding domain
VPPLADLQERVARSVILGKMAAACDFVGGAEPVRRLLIHRRHYVASLSASLREKFPATVWLLGTDAVDAAARTYIEARPPTRPCIAEYGEDFPAFLADRAPARLPYLRSFAELEWALGRVSIEIDEPPILWDAMIGIGSEVLLGAELRLQSGLRYVQSSWNIDRLIGHYLEDAAPDAFELIEEDALIEVRGARGTLGMERLDAPTFTFRKALTNRRTITEAAAETLDCDPAFDPGEALRVLAHAGLVVEAIAADERRTE